MIEIFSPDTFRRSVESASSGNATILYDAYGNPNFMSVIPRKTLGEIYPTAWISEHDGTGADTHPAFIVQDTTGGSTTEVDQIFINQYPNTIQNNCGVSMPNQIPYHGDRTDFDAYTTNKGSGWHIMNALEYGLLWGLVMEADNNLKGNTVAVYSDTTEEFNYSGDRAAKSMLFEIETDTLSCVTDMTAGEIVTFDSGGQGILVNTYRTHATYSNVTTGYMIVIQVDVGSKIEGSSSFTGLTSLETGSITQILMHETLGAGPVSWTHNKSPWGVWMLGAGREYIDSCFLGPDGTFAGPVLQCVRNNYREQSDRDLETLTTNIGVYIEWAHHINYMTVVGGQATAHGNNDGLLGWNGKSYYRNTNNGWTISHNAVDYADDADFLLLKEMGLYPPFTNSYGSASSTSWPNRDNIRDESEHFCTMYTDVGDRMYLCRGGWQLGYPGEVKSMHSSTFTSAEAYSTYYDRNCLRFRTVYIPEI